MPMRVSKFGGSSTADAGCFRRMLSILTASPSRRCAVLSAPGLSDLHEKKVTAMLADCWRLRRRGRALRAAVEAVADRYVDIALPLGVKGFRQIAEREIEGALGLSEAHVLSRGEYLCALLFSMYSGIPMADAAGVICFDAGGVLNTDRTLARFIALSREYDRVIVPGFYGAEPGGRIRTFPRNGSDITGALASAGMGAGLYENWTDVPGLMTADPAIVPNARLIAQVSYRQMRALARAGAQVLHPACLDPVALAGIPTRLRLTKSPERYGTLIDDRVMQTAACMAGKREAALPTRCHERGESACVSVFGVAAEKVADAAKLLKPILTEPGRDCVRVYVEREAFEMSLRALHTRLIETAPCAGAEESPFSLDS